MFAWCVSCQQCLGERPPFEDYGLTHGLCATCTRRGTAMDAAAVARIRPIANFHRELLAHVERGEAALDVDVVLEKGRALGLRIVDLLVGVLQPTLYEVGKRWQAGSLTAAHEVEFSRLCDRVLDRIDRELPSLESPEIVLMNAHWNRHTLGIRMAAVAMRAQGLQARVLTPTPSLEELPALLERLRPAVLGISFAVEWQLTFLDVVRDILAQLPHPPRLVVGGGASSSPLIPADVLRWKREAGWTEWAQLVDDQRHQAAPR